VTHGAAIIVEILLGLLLAALVAIGVILCRIERRLAEWRAIWDNLPPIATDYHSREIMHIIQEIAHYIALHPGKPKSRRRKSQKIEVPNINDDPADRKLL
jgi:hypothetical protein